MLVIVVAAVNALDPGGVSSSGREIATAAGRMLIVPNHFVPCEVRVFELASVRLDCVEDLRIGCLHSIVVHLAVAV